MIDEGQLQAAVLNEGLQAGGGEPGIEWEPGPARLPDRQHGDHQVGGAVDRQSDHHLGADTECDQLAGEALGLVAEFAIGELLVAAEQGGAEGLLVRLLCEERGDGDGGDRAFGTAAPGEQLRAFRGIEELDGVDGSIGVGGELFEGAEEAVDEAGGGGGVVEVGTVLEQSAESSGGEFLEAPEEIELGGGVGERFGGQFQPGEGLGDGPGVLQDEHDLEQGVSGEGAVGLEGVDELLEGEFLVGEGGEVKLADAAEHLAEGGAAGEVGAEDEGVDVEADLVMQGLVETSRDGTSQGDVGAGAKAGEEDGECCLEDHEEAGPLLAGESLEAGLQEGGDVAGDRAAAVGGDTGPGPVRGEGQLFGQAGESLGPEGEFAGENTVGLVGGTKPALLPEGVVGVLDRERWEPGGVPGQMGGVGSGEIVPEGREGGSITGDVMQDEQQDLLGGAEGEDADSQGEVAVELEGERGGVGEAFREVGGGDRFDLEGQGERIGGEDLLPGDASLGGEPGAEGLVAVEQVTQGEAEGVEVERPAEAVCEGDVIGGAGPLELLEEPHPLLCGGEGKPLGPGFGAEGRTEIGGGTAGLAGGDPVGQGGDGGGLEESADGELDAEFRADAGGESGGEEGVSAEVEEAGVAIDGVAEEEFAPEACEGEFEG
jgi:hypothetical protein